MNCKDSYVRVKGLETDSKDPLAASVEGIVKVNTEDYYKETSLGCIAADAVVAETSFGAAVVAEPVMPIAHWLEVLCCWTLQMDHADSDSDIQMESEFP